MVVGRVDDLSALVPFLLSFPHNIMGLAWSELKVIFYLAVLLALSHTVCCQSASGFHATSTRVC